MNTAFLAKSPFASTLPGRYYYDPTLFAREQERIFSKMWVYACRADALPELGSYQVGTLAGESIVIVRDKNNRVQAYLNVCRHRGARLCNQQSGYLKGSIQCHYHAWTYALDGQLIGAPNVLRESEFDRSAHSLFPLALKIWEGLIWLNLSEELLPLTIRSMTPLYMPLLVRHHMNAIM